MQNENKTIAGIMAANGMAFLLIAGLVLGLLAFLLFGALQYAEDVENQTGVMSLEDRCEFVVKTSGESFNISEPSAGTYKYELYATADGYVEVWKCK